MEFVLANQERCGGYLQTSRVSVERGKVTSATPAFAWAIGQGLHVVLSWCARRGITWKRKRVRRQPGQMELAL
jgi:hypothetical protein